MLESLPKIENYYLKNDEDVWDDTNWTNKKHEFNLKNYKDKKFPVYGVLGTTVYEYRRKCKS